MYKLFKNLKPTSKASNQKKTTFVRSSATESYCVRSDNDYQSDIDSQNISLTFNQHHQELNKNECMLIIQDSLYRLQDTNKSLEKWKIFKSTLPIIDDLIDNKTLETEEKCILADILLEHTRYNFKAYATDSDDDGVISRERFNKSLTAIRNIVPDDSERLREANFLCAYGLQPSNILKN